MDASPPPASRGTRRLVVAWLPPVAWAAVIFALSAQSGLRFVPDDALDFVVRKLGHVAVFGILALLAWRALAMTTTWRRPWAWALALTVLYAITDELHQAFVTTRHSSVVDVGFDGVGAIVAVLAAAAVARARTRRSQDGQRGTWRVRAR